MTTTTSTNIAAARTANLDRVAGLDPVFAQMVSATTRHEWSIPELSEREKVFLCVVADVCQPSLGLPFEVHVSAATAHGVSTGDIRALLRFISHDCGYPAALEAFARLAEIEAAAGIPRPDAELLAEDLLVPGPSPLPDFVRDPLRELDAHFLEHFDLQSRLRSDTGPGTLSVRERAFASMSIDIHYQTLEETFRIHVDRALRGGAKSEDVRAVLRFNAQFGVTRAWRAWKALNAHLG